MPLFLRGVLTGAVTFAILALERHGFRPLEAVITAMVGSSLSVTVETILGRPDGARLPTMRRAALQGKGASLGDGPSWGHGHAPTVVFLHSALTQGRIVCATQRQLRRLFRFEWWT